MTAALSDGKRLYAVRYATDDAAPSLYHRWSDTRQGRAVVSEPLEAEEGGWEEVPSYSFCTFDGGSVTVEEFLPCQLSAAA
jgi:glutamine amidotransferase